MTRDELALALWAEQIASGLGDPGETANEPDLERWYQNRTYDLTLLDEAAAGDVSALAQVRTEAGLSILV